MGNFSKEMETISKSYIEMVKMKKKIAIELKSAFKRLISRLTTATAEGRISKLENISM